MSDIEQTLQAAAAGLLRAYDCRAIAIVGYAERQAWFELTRENAITLRDVELVCRFVAAHRRGKFGDRAPEIPQSPQSALERFGELLARAQAKAAQMRRERQEVRCEQAPVQPYEESGYQPADAEDFAKLRKFREGLANER